MLQNVVVRQFRDHKYLSLAKSGSTIEQIQDIADVILYDPDIDEDNQIREQLLWLLSH